MQHDTIVKIEIKGTGNVQDYKQCSMTNKQAKLPIQKDDNA